MHVSVKDDDVFATLSSGCLVDWVHSRSDNEWFIEQHESLYRFCCFVMHCCCFLLFGLWYSGSAPDLLKSVGSKGLVARIGSLVSKGLVMLLYFVSGVVGS